MDKKVKNNKDSTTVESENKSVKLPVAGDVIDALTTVESINSSVELPATENVVEVDDKSKDVVPTNEYQKLSPTDKADINGYEKALNYVFLNKDVRNIAISGAYGAGKSSVINSYEKKVSIKAKDGLASPKKFIHISLANFDSNTVGKNLEEKIHNQLVYKIKQNNIPLADDKVKRNKKKLVTFLNAVFVFLFVVSIIIVFANQFVVDMAEKKQIFYKCIKNNSI